MKQGPLKQSASGSLYAVAASGATIGLGFIRTVLLMRLLGPQPFGEASLAFFLAMFLVPFSTLGVDGALIQKKVAGEEAYSTHFLLRMIFGAITLGFSFLAAPLLRRYYPAIIVNLFLVFLGINLFAASYSTPGAILRRDLRFGPIAALNLFASLAMTVTAPLLAYFGAGVWSLVAEQAAGSVIRWFGLWFVFKPWKIQLRFYLEEGKSLLKFGYQFSFSNLLGILLDRFDDFWTGSILGASALGYYSRAYEIAQYPERVLATPITNVYFSTYAALQEKRTELSRAFHQSSWLLTRAGFLIAVLLAAITPEFTLLLFGKVWIPIVPVFRLMLVYILLDPLNVSLGYLLIGVGRPDLLSRIRLAQLALFVPAVALLGRAGGISGVAIAADVMMLSGLAALIVASRKYADFSLREIFALPVVASILSAIPALAIDRFIPVQNPWVMLISKSVAISLIYLLVVYSFEKEALKRYLHLARQLVWDRKNFHSISLGVD